MKVYKKRGNCVLQLNQQESCKMGWVLLLAGLACEFLKEDEAQSIAVLGLDRRGLQEAAAFTEEVTGLLGKLLPTKKILTEADFPVNPQCFTTDELEPFDHKER